MFSTTRGQTSTWQCCCGVGGFSSTICRQCVRRDMPVTINRVLLPLHSLVLLTLLSLWAECSWLFVSWKIWGIMSLSYFTSCPSKNIDFRQTSSSDFIRSKFKKPTVTTDLELKRLYTGLRTTPSLAHTGFYLTWPFTTRLRLGFHMTVTRQCWRCYWYPVSCVTIKSYPSSTSSKNPFRPPHWWPSLETASCVPSLPSTTRQPSCYSSWLGLGWRRYCQFVFMDIPWR